MQACIVLCHFQKDFLKKQMLNSPFLKVGVIRALYQVQQKIGSMEEQFHGGRTGKTLLLLYAGELIIHF